MKAASVTLVACIGWIVFYVGSFAALGGSVPTVESSGQEILDWFINNGDRARAYAWTAPFAALALTVFGAMITALLPAPHRYVFLGGLLMWVITGLVQAWFWAGLALRPEDLDAGTAQTLFDIAQYWGPIINASTMTMAVALVALGFSTTRPLPWWLVWSSVALFVEQAIETVTVFGTSGFIAPGGAMNLYLGGLIGLAWTVALLVWGYSQWRSQPIPDPS